MSKFHEVARISKGNKKNFISNMLTRALATLSAQEDYEKEQKRKNKKEKKAFYKSN